MTIETRLKRLESIIIPNRGPVFAIGGFGAERDVLYVEGKRFESEAEVNLAYPDRMIFVIKVLADVKMMDEI